MTNFKCFFCGERMEITKPMKGKVSPVLHVFWHDYCVDNPKYKLTQDQKIFWHTTGQEFD